MQYLFLGVAIAGELLGTTLLKFSNGFTKLFPSVASMITYGISFYFLAKALEKINYSIAYATWSALGILVTTIISITLFKEKISPAGIGGLILIVIGVIVLNLYGGVVRT